MLNRKIYTLILILLLLLSVISILIPKNHYVKADSGEGGEGSIGLDYQYIRTVSEYLSQTIVNAYNDTELQKGRAFGSKGEHYAMEYINDSMNDDLNLWNVTIEDLEPIEQNQEIGTKLEVLSKSVTINDTYTIDCYIGPRWNYSRLESTFPNLDQYAKRVDYNRDNLTHNFSYQDFIILIPL